MTIAARERETYDAMWALPAYSDRSPGEMYVPLFLDMAKPNLDEWHNISGNAYRVSVLDAGCGAGDGALALQKAGFRDVQLCDLTNAGLKAEAHALPFYQVCLWDDLASQMGFLLGGKVDYVYCCDVLEHVPTPFTMLVVSRLLEVARRGVFLSISLMPDQFGAWVGKPLHHTVQAFPAWLEQLSEIGRVREARDLLHCGVFYLEPRA